MVKTTHRILLEWKLIPLLKSKKHGDVLDVGSKDARYKKHMDFTSYTTLDIEPSFHPDIVGDVEFYTSNKKYDTILLSQVIEHVKNPEICLKSISELLKPNGILIMTSPLLFQVHGSEDYWRFTTHGLRLMLDRYFRQVKVEGYGNFIASSWDQLHFFNRLPFMNHIVAFTSLIFGNQHCECGYLTQTIK